MGAADEMVLEYGTSTLQIPHPHSESRQLTKVQTGRAYLVPGRVFALRAHAQATCDRWIDHGLQSFGGRYIADLIEL